MNDEERLSLSQVAEIKGMPRQLMAYYLNRDDAPEPIEEKPIRVWYLAHILSWDIKPRKRGRKPKQ